MQYNYIYVFFIICYIINYIEFIYYIHNYALYIYKLYIYVCCNYIYNNMLNVIYIFMT